MITLRRGRRGPEVSRWQRFLSEQQLLDGKTDGIFGADTELASRKFQEREGLKEDGVVGSKTFMRARELGFVGLRRLREHELDSALLQHAQRILRDHHDEPFGTESAFDQGDQRYVGRIEEHFHPVGGARRPWGYHVGVSLFIEIGEGLDEPVQDDA